MLYYIKHILSSGDDKVTCLFNADEVRVVNLKDIVENYRKLNDGLISQLTDHDYFKSAQLDSYGTLTWENGVDFDPDNLYQMSKPQIVSN